MHEVLLQTIVEKLERLEIALLKQSHTTKESEPSNALATLVDWSSTKPGEAYSSFS